jgi:hypothetical protein
MNPSHIHPLLYRSLICLFVLAIQLSSARATELIQLTAANWDEFAPAGKEVDAIYGDYVLRNDKIVAVIAQPLVTRNANMTVRSVGGCVIDLTRIKFPNDQLSCFYPTAGSYRFEDPKKVRVQAGEWQALTEDTIKHEQIQLEIASSGGPAGLDATIRYSLSDGDAFLGVETIITNTTDRPIPTKLEDSMRADRTFDFGQAYDGQLFWAYDQTFNQAYGIFAKGYRAEKAGGRAVAVNYSRDGESVFEVAPEKSISFSRQLIPAGSQLQLLAQVGRAMGEKWPRVEINIADAAGPINNAYVRVNSDGNLYGIGHVGREGKLVTTLPEGEYQIEVTAVARLAVKSQLKVAGPTELAVKLDQCGYVSAKIDDELGKRIPCKVAFYGIEGTADPNYGDDARATSMKNLRYSMGRFKQAIAPGKYEVVISRGPEYDAEVRTIQVTGGSEVELAVQLKRVVDSTGWISGEYHSHSSPSGDNTSDQLGRVQNLLAEHLEFAPCTEHNRIDSYLPHIERLKAQAYIATCSGMELTGALLPVNHQNVFPLIYKPRTQDGGGPVTDNDPEVQIERIAMWDNNSDKLVQTNHPNLAQIYGDRDTDGKADQGFRKMLKFMDVIEVHPPATIFNTPGDGVEVGSRGNTILHWMQLLNLGYRIPGVVNTDAHYNFHGSGGLRNYIKSRTDDPAAIDTMEMVAATEKGNIIMTTGPFMEVQFSSSSGDEKSLAIAGEDARGFEGKGELHVKVQCANWLDVNRVQVFVNGRAEKSLNFTRREHPQMFGDKVVKFDQTIPIVLKEDAHLIVAAIGQEMKLGRVMGPDWGKQPPVAVSNPIFVDIDANGFKPNGDLLDQVLPGAQPNPVSTE